MGSTYLDLTNTVLRRLNEVPLTADTFATAGGFHAMVKDSINAAIRDINHSDQQWPFNYTATTQLLSADVAAYALPADVAAVDWDSFYLNKDDALAVTARPLPYLDYPIYQAYRKAADDNAATGAVPKAVYRTNAGEFGLTPWPDQAYTVAFGYWAQPAELASSTDTTTIPSQWDYVIVDRALFYAFTFRRETDVAQQYAQYFENHKKDMRRMLVRAPSRFTDTRVSRAITGAF